MKSKRDGLTHWINGQELAKLYGLDYEDCLIGYSKDQDKDLNFYPRDDGNYDPLPKVEIGPKGVPPFKSVKLTQGTLKVHGKQLERAREALIEIRNRNPLKCDSDAYLFDLAEWGLGNEVVRPIRETYGLEQ